MLRAYLDHAASSPMSASVVEAMAVVWQRAGNPSSLHTAGRGLRRILEQARESIAADLGARPSEVVFCSGGTEANNLALLGAAGPDGGLVVSAVEHPSVARVRDVLGSRVVVAPVDAEGRVDAASLRSALTRGTRCLSVMWANNETGVLEPVDELVEVARSAGVISHSDAVQAVGHVPVDFAASGLDLLSLSAHKLGGPVGIGALVVRRGVSVVPTGFGGGQESRVRSGTVPVALAVGFAAALRDAVARLDTEALRLTALGDRLIAGVRGIPEVRVNTVGAASPAIVHVTVRGTRADDVLLLLDAGGIDCSTGSACAAGVHQPSEVLLAMGRTAAEAAAGLRFSFGPTTTAADVETLLAVLPSAVERARSAFRD